MYCPECGGEYRDGFFNCADCGVALVENPPAPAEHTWNTELVTVLETGDPAEIAFLESLFQDARIPLYKKGESLQDLFAMGRIGLGFNALTGPVLLQVPQQHAEAALRLLRDLPPPEPLDGEELAEPE